MKKEFTPEYIYLNKGCYDKQQVDNLSFINKKSISIKDLFDGLPIKDFTWFLVRKCDLTNLEKVNFAIHCAEFSLKFFEEKYPDDKRPFDAIQAAKDYTLSPCSTAAAAVYATASAAAVSSASAASATSAASASAASAAAAATSAYAASASAASSVYAVYATTSATSAVYATTSAELTEYRNHVWKFVALNK